LNDVQNAEDEVMRDRRISLRAAGYCFLTDRPDFVNANAVGNNVVYPPVATSRVVPLADLGDGEIRRIEIEQRAYLVRRSGETIHVWPGVCPHEGAVLEPAHVRASIVRCPWHGLEFGMRPLKPSSSTLNLCGAVLQLKDDGLHISPVAR
jgi:hypothetical protein